MATITIDLGSAAQTTRIVNAICGFHGYDPTPGGVANPEDKPTFARRIIVEHVKTIVRNQETFAAQQTAAAGVAAPPLT